MSTSRDSNWLVVEDNDDDFLLFNRACGRALNSVKLDRAVDGLAAQELLSRPVLPDFIISDLNMPRVNGLELLVWVRGQPRLAHVPFVMFSSSAHAKDREAALRCGADGYLVKPSTLEDLANLVRGVCAQQLVLVQRSIEQTEARLAELYSRLELSMTAADVLQHHIEQTEARVAQLQARIEKLFTDSTNESKALSVLQETLKTLRIRHELLRSTQQIASGKRPSSP